MIIISIILYFFILGPEWAGMTGVIRGTEYPLLHEILLTVSKTIPSPAQTTSVWLLVLVQIVAKDWCEWQSLVPENQLILGS